MDGSERLCVSPDAEDHPCTCEWHGCKPSSKILSGGNLMKQLLLLVVLAALVAAASSSALAQEAGENCDTYSIEAGVALFDLPGCDQSGESWTTEEVGEYNLAFIEFNDRASSLAVAEGWSALVYSDILAYGHSTCMVPGTMWDLGQDFWPGTSEPISDSISSVRVFNNPACEDTMPEPVTCDDMSVQTGILLFDEPGCLSSGTSAFLAGEMAINLSEVSPIPFDNLATSTMVAPGWSARVYSEAGFGGNSTCLLAGTMWNLSLDVWPGTQVPMSDDIESVRVFNNPDCQEPVEEPDNFVNFLPLVSREEIVKTYCDTFSQEKGVALFSKPGCEQPGEMVQFAEAGTYSLGDFANKTASTYVSTGWSMRVYSGPNRTGNSHCLIPGSMWDLALDVWPGTQVPMSNDIESIRVFDNPDCQP